jgi:hypothetical protein
MMECGVPRLFGLGFVALAPRICDVISWRLRGDRSSLVGMVSNQIGEHPDGYVYDEVNR